MSGPRGLLGFLRPSRSAAGARPTEPSAPSRPRAHVEEVGFLCARGWALADGELTLQIDGVPIRADVRRLPRPDVQAHWMDEAAGVQAPGFVVRLRRGDLPGLEAQPQWQGHVALCQHGRQLVSWTWTLDLDRLRQTAESLWDADDHVQEEAWPHLAEWLAVLPGAGLLRQKLISGWRTRGGLPGERVRVCIEHTDPLVARGWAMTSTGQAVDDFEVHCGGARWRPTVLRHERDDVARPLQPTLPPGQRLALVGFELAWPAGIWVADQAAPTLWLTVGGRRATRTSLTWSRTDREQAWTALRARAARGDPEADDLLAWLRRACGEGGGGADADVAALSGEHGSRTERDEGPHRALREWQRTLNQRLMDGESLTDAFAAMMARRETGPDEDAWARFTLSLVPAFCAVDALPALRPHLSDELIDPLRHADAAWELSLLWSVRVLDDLPSGRLNEAAALLRRLAHVANVGWLNTECVADGLVRVARSVAKQPLDDADMTSLVQAGCAWLAGMADTAGKVSAYEDEGAWWSRLTDQHVQRAAAALVTVSRAVPESLAASAEALVLQFLGLSPTFWRVCDAARVQGSTAAWDQVRALCDAWVRVDRSVQRGDVPAADEVERLLFDSLTRGLTGTRSRARHLVAQGGPQAEVAARILARTPSTPLAAELGEFAVDGAGDLAAATETPAHPWPPSRHRATRRALRLAEQAWQEADRLQAPALRAATLDETWHRLREAAMPLLSMDAGCQGLSAFAAAACTKDLPRPLASAVQGTLEEATQFVADMLRRRRHELPVPPAPVIAVLARLAARGHPALLSPVQAAVAVGWGLAWSDLAAGSEDAPERSAYAAGDGADRSVDTLVVVRVRPGDAAERVRHIASGWAKDLRAWSAAWCLWEPGDGSQASVPDAVPRLQASGLMEVLEQLTTPALRRAAGVPACDRLLFVDDDVELDMWAYHTASDATVSHFHGALAGAGKVAVGLGLTLSWAAARLAVDMGRSIRGARLRAAAEDEEGALAACLARHHVVPSDRGHAIHMRRRPGPPGGLFHNLWLGAGSDVVLTTRHDGEPWPPGEGWERPDSKGLGARVWPPYQRPRLSGGEVASQQLIRWRQGNATEDRSPCVIAVARNERVMLPHFLGHYRSLGVRRFVIADNQSTDGTLDYLLEQPDVTVYTVDTQYRHSHYGVAWQCGMLAAHAQRSWALVADLDELLVWPGCEQEGLAALCARLQAAGHDAATVLMVDMYPEGPLQHARFDAASPFIVAPWFDARPVHRWALGSGSFSNGRTAVSAVRHRLLPDSPPNYFTAQKVALMRYSPNVRLSEGLHYASGLEPAEQPLYFAHFKYHHGFQSRVDEEIARAQHYNGAEEYRRYRALWTEAHGLMHEASLSRRFDNSHSFAGISWN